MLREKTVLTLPGMIVLPILVLAGLSALV